MKRLGMTTPEAAMSLGIVQNRITRSLGEGRHGLDLGLVAPTITRSLGAEGDEPTSVGGALLATAAMVGITALFTGLGFASYQKHGSPWRAGLVVGGVTGAFIFAGWAARRWS